jgi:hypothetical protein
MRIRAQAVGLDGGGLDGVALFNETALAAAPVDYPASVDTRRAELDGGEAELARPQQRDRHDRPRPADASHTVAITSMFIEHRQGSA